MIAIRRAALLVALVAATTPAVAEGQAPSPDSLIHRIVMLERTTASLEQRVSDLEALIKKVEPSRNRPVPASANGRDIANWRRLRRGMTADEVRALLGEPQRVLAPSAYMTLWYYPNQGNVSFTSEQVDGWSEPAR